MITSIEHDRRMVPLAPLFSDPTRNVFTVVVGKNGIGKSRLLSSLASEASRWSSSKKIRDFTQFNRVIAISTSPFDKFPIGQSPLAVRSNDETYRYIGLRGRLGSVSSVAMIATAAKGLIGNFQYHSNRYQLSTVFEMLGLKSHSEFIFKLVFDLSTKNGIEEYRRSTHDPSIESDSIGNLTSRDIDKINKFLSAIAMSVDRNDNFILALNFDYNEILINGRPFFGDEAIDPILLLLSRKIIKLMDLRVFKKEYGVMSLRRASSGEQCVLVSMLGIAAHITDQSLILIDEPEISLHPEWQEKYIELLVKTFAHYKECQFVIATHSPQIVANLPSDDCYVLSLVSNELQAASKYNNRSSDYQLAELFGAPCHNNEYVGRLALSLFLTVSKHKTFSVTDQEKYANLLRLTNGSQHDDSVRELITSIRLMKKDFS